MSSKPFVAQWGIWGTGWIADKFVGDLTLERADVTDVAHAVSAVASRSIEKAAAFIKTTCPEGGSAQKAGLVDSKPESCESLAALLSHPRVDIVYIGTPNVFHYADAKQSLEAGKHVLVEKPATLNSAEWQSLCDIAKKKQVFLMEGMWTRFLPICSEIQKLLFEDKAIGDVRAVHCDFSQQFFGVVPTTHRSLNPSLGGGSLLDLGVYSMTWALVCLYHNPANEGSLPENLTSSMLLTEQGVDLSTSFTFDFPKLHAKAFLSSSFAYNSGTDYCLRVTGTKGELTAPFPCSGPRSYTLRQAESIGVNVPCGQAQVKPVPRPGFGLHYEADAVARSIAAGELENKVLPHSESLLVAKMLDQIRKQGGYVYEKGLEAVQLD